MLYFYVPDVIIISTPEGTNRRGAQPHYPRMADGRLYNDIFILFDKNGGL